MQNRGQGFWGSDRGMFFGTTKAQEAEEKKQPPHVGLFGFSFSNPNLGLHALGLAAIDLFLKKQPEAKFFCFTVSSKEPASVEVNGKIVPLKSFYIRIGKKTCLFPNNIYNLYFRSLFYKWFRIRLFRRKSALGSLAKCRIAFDISAGDSFSDLYGMEIFWLICLQKMIVENLGVPLVLLPQTYGPFRAEKARIWARKTILSAKSLLSRDEPSKDCLKDELKIEREVKVCPDLAFALSDRQTGTPSPQNFIGINVNGLLYHSGLKTQDISAEDYSKIIQETIAFFIDKNELVYLMPHVIGSNARNDDVLANEKIVKKWNHPRVLAMTPILNEYDFRAKVKGAKFFLGSRLHACIAAASQEVPTICLAYSRKFKGVMQVIGYEKFVLSIEKRTPTRILEEIKKLYDCRREAVEILKKNAPLARQKVQEFFDKEVLV